MKRKVYVIIIVFLAFLLFCLGCEDKEEDSSMPLVEETPSYTLTMEIEGQGEVSPATGNHIYDGGSIVDIEAVPAEGWEFSEWVGNVAANDDRVTTVTMNREQTVRAVFILAEAEEEVIMCARVKYEERGQGVTSGYEMWNCTGLEGVWNWKNHMVMAGFGAVTGEGTFIMPPRPADYPASSWISESFEALSEGSLNVDGVSVTIVHRSTNRAEITGSAEEGWTMLWSGRFTVTVSAMGQVMTQTSESFSSAPLVITFHDPQD